MLLWNPVIRRQSVAENRPHTERLEEVGRDRRARHADAIAAAGQRDRALEVGRDLLERAGLLPPVLEVRGRDAVARLRVHPIVLPDRHHPGGIAERQRPQQDRVDDREDGGVGADAEGERQHDDRGEAGTLPHQAQRVAKILEQHVETPLLAEEAPRVGDRAERPGHHAGAIAPGIAAAVLPGGGELRLPLGAKLAAGAARGEARDHGDEPAEDVRHGGCRG